MLWQFVVKEPGRFDKDHRLNYNDVVVVFWLSIRSCTTTTARENRDAM